MASPVIEQGMASHLKGRNRFLNMWLHDVASRLKIRRKALARDAGLEDSYDVGTYPQQQTIVRGGIGNVASALLTAGAMGLGGAGMLAATQLLGSHTSSRAAAVPQPPAAGVFEREFEITVETVDGQMKVTGVQEVE